MSAELFGWMDDEVALEDEREHRRAYHAHLDALQYENVWETTEIDEGIYTWVNGGPRGM